MGFKGQTEIRKDSRGDGEATRYQALRILVRISGRRRAKPGGTAGFLLLPQQFFELRGQEFCS